MLESLAFTLLKTFVAYMFHKALHQADTVHIDGAPQWYYQTLDNHACASGFAWGGLEAVDAAKANARDALVRHIDDTVKAVIHENFRYVENPAERELVARFEDDESLPRFVLSSARIHNMEYREEVRTAFARTCVEADSLVSYEKERLQTIRVAVLDMYSGEAFRELEGDSPTDSDRDEAGPDSPTGPPAPTGNDPFRELDRATPID